MCSSTCAFVFDIERQYGVAAKIAHRGAKFPAGFCRKHVAMKSVARKRSRNSSIRTDQPKVKTKLLGDRQSKHVPPTGHQDDFDSLGMGTA
jgi:hypothetical protein